MSAFTPQVIAAVLVTASQAGLVGLAFSLVYRTTRLFNFWTAACITISPYATLLLTRSASLFTAVIFSLLVGIALTALMDFSIFRILRKVPSPNPGILASLGLLTVATSVIAIVFGSGPQTLRSWTVKPGIIILGSRLTIVHIITISCAVIIFIVVGLMFKYTRTGRLIGAVANDPHLAEVFGIPVELMYLITSMLSMALAGLAGILTAADTDMTPTMGMQSFMIGMVGAIIGGNTVAGTAVGIVLLMLIQNLAVLWISAKWQIAITYLILIVFLVVKPVGLFGKPMKKAVV